MIVRGDCTGLCAAGTAFARTAADAARLASELRAKWIVLCGLRRPAREAYRLRVLAPGVHLAARVRNQGDADQCAAAGVVVLRVASACEGMERQTATH